MAGKAAVECSPSPATSPALRTRCHSVMSGPRWPQWLYPVPTFLRQPADYRLCCLFPCSRLPPQRAWSPRLSGCLKHWCQDTPDKSLTLDYRPVRVRRGSRSTPAMSVVLSLSLFRCSAAGHLAVLPASLQCGLMELPESPNLGRVPSNDHWGVSHLNRPHAHLPPVPWRPSHQYQTDGTV
ncbi:uncharacterized protein LY79DRAFT_356169 [Colletotrichum navitas]|uniref:Uncharacterized protein n=1 Tax=Colletotrichum navitas TaxID=681940 RepID=A0AAD8QAI7_9PEZI|nr:uncharacterized protein LY79DRAFT_356169 [Colletotrichum navitas]KAK1597778.1 hypothetical protein LY79DRAFT_356169 [Colletotrichum navitas]